MPTKPSIVVRRILSWASTTSVLEVDELSVARSTPILVCMVPCISCFRSLSSFALTHSPYHEDRKPQVMPSRAVSLRKKVLKKMFLRGFQCILICKAANPTNLTFIFYSYRIPWPAPLRWRPIAGSRSRSSVHRTGRIPADGSESDHHPAAQGRGRLLRGTAEKAEKGNQCQKAAQVLTARCGWLMTRTWLVFLTSKGVTTTDFDKTFRNIICCLHFSPMSNPALLQTFSFTGSLQLFKLYSKKRTQSGFGRFLFSLHAKLKF